jgi:hypothetical protein
VPDIYVSTSGVWKKINSAFVSSGGVWKQITSGYVSSGGVWKRFFSSSVSPSVESRVTISRNNATYPSTLTGTNYRWSDSTSLTYVFQKSSDDSSWTDIGTATSIANPPSGSTNTVTYALTIADMPAFTSYYRFVVTATNSTYSTTTTSTSTSVSVTQPAPINTVAPAVTPTTGNPGTQYTTTNGTWNPDDADGTYAYQWQYNDQGSTFLAISGATSSTYTPPSNFLSLYVSPIRCRVTATNATGSTAAFSNQVAVTAAKPSGGSVTLTPTGTQYNGTQLTASTSGWTGSPTSYAIGIYASTSTPSPGAIGTVLKASSTTSSVTYTISASDATPPAYYFKAFATATNAGGTSDQVESNLVTSLLLKAPNVPTSLTTPSSGTAPNLIFNSSSWTAPASDSSYGPAAYYRVFFEAATSSSGPWFAVNNTFTYLNSSGTATTATNAYTDATAVNVYATNVTSGKITSTSAAYTWVRMSVKSVNAAGSSAYVTAVG